MNKTIRKQHDFTNSPDTDAAGVSEGVAPKRRATNLEKEMQACQKEALATQERVANLNQLSAQLAMIEGPLAVALGNFSVIINDHMNRQGFWSSDNTGEKIALMHSELSEALEADRKDMDAEHIPGFLGIEEELADTVIRILDFAAQRNLRLGEAMVSKMRYNLRRPFMHGKNY